MSEELARLAGVSLADGEAHPSTGDLVNICVRVIVSFLACLACWFPFRLLYRNGEVAGSIMVIVIAIRNFYTATNAIIWHNNDIENWYSGVGWCDLQNFTVEPLENLNAACICAVMYHISSQISLMRVSMLTSEERIKKHVVQLLIVFPVFIIQIIMTYFVQNTRFTVYGIAGCYCSYASNLVTVFIFMLPVPIFTFLAAIFAVLTWWRYRQIDKVSRSAMLRSGNTAVSVRSARTKRKLYFMALTIIVPYLPLQFAYLVGGLYAGRPWRTSYNFTALHADWNHVVYLPSKLADAGTMYGWIGPAAEVIIFYLYFGRSKEAYDMYRRHLCVLGLGRIFPKLKEEWFPDSARNKVSTSKYGWSRSESTKNDTSTLQQSTDDKGVRLERDVTQSSDVGIIWEGSPTGMELSDLKTVCIAGAASRPPVPKTSRFASLFHKDKELQDSAPTSGLSRVISNDSTSCLRS